MERKRTRLRSSSSYDEEEEEERGEEDRKLTLRRRKNPRYNEDDDEDEEVEEEGEEDNEQPSGPSTQNNHTQERFLKVTCGNKTGQLDKDKLYQAVKCIKCGDGWFSPSAFEELGGKGASKKWKTSILHDKKPLKFWIDRGMLTTPGFKKRERGAEKMKIRSSSRISERSSEEESEIQSTEESEEDDVKDEDWCPASEELVLETEEERVELGNNEEVVDSGVDENKEEEDEVEKGEMEDEDVAAVEGNDSSDAEGRAAKSPIISTPLREVKVVIRRLPEFQVQTNGLEEDPLKDSEDAQSEDERARSGSPADDLSITASDTSTIGADEKESREEFTEDSEREEDQQREIKTESSPTLSRDIKPEAEHMGSLCDHTASLCASPVLAAGRRAVVKRWKKKKKESKQRWCLHFLMTMKMLLTSISTCQDLTPPQLETSEIAPRHRRSSRKKSQLRPIMTLPLHPRVYLLNVNVRRQTPPPLAVTQQNYK